LRLCKSNARRFRHSGETIFADRALSASGSEAAPLRVAHPANGSIRPREEQERIAFGTAGKVGQMFVSLVEEGARLRFVDGMLMGDDMNALKALACDRGLQSREEAEVFFSLDRMMTKAGSDWDNLAPDRRGSRRLADRLRRRQADDARLASSSPPHARGRGLPAPPCRHLRALARGAGQSDLVTLRRRLPLS
jgi:hypothetical protein